ncbi:hypothetical protein KAR91_23065, partial [Candidatus Pacearchaeota archaeon]|nr:hypothetical protein [Candidatus Pacearchaeota archaeon]
GRWGVQAIGYEHPLVGWTMATGGDFYIQLSDRFIAVDRYGMIDWVINHFEKVEAVWAGRTISNVEYIELYNQAKIDMKVEKTGRLRTERKSSDD